MAMKKTAKKSKRRLKRSVRRSLAAVLMITAIGVAAIPVPENYAAPEDGIIPYADTVEYYYPGSESDPDYDPDVPENNLKFKEVSMLSYDENYPNLSPGSARQYYSHTIRLMSDNTWQAEWQFRFFQQRVGGQNRGIISEYNNTYQENEVRLKANVVMDYAWVEVSDYNSYYASNDKEEITLTRPNATNATQARNEALLKEYFPDAYNEFVRAYQAYETALNQWNAGSGAEMPQEPDPLERKVSDLTGEQKLKYYCDRMGYEGCTLVSVTDMRMKTDDGTDDPQNSIVYIPRKNEGATLPEGYSSDDNSFVYANDQTSSIIGIGDKAFKGTRNVNVLDVPDEIRYIGESAFESSFIAKISFNNVMCIDNYAFKNCSRLTDITMGATTAVIGTEAFYGSGLTSVQFPNSITNIGPGAFAFCGALTSLDFSGVSDQSQAGIRIGDYAFYNDVGLSSVNFIRAGGTASVNIKTIGEGAFAVESGITGNLTDFVFPSVISQTKDKKDTNSLTGLGTTGLGNLVLAGRTNLKTVTMPADYGRSAEVIVPDDIFYNCIQLDCVIFPDDGNRSCGLADYNSKELFKSVTNPDFYVRGPELDRGGLAAAPRRATWDANTAVSDKVPYMYVRNGVEYYEISDGYYLLCIDNKGMLTSCIIKPNRDGSEGSLAGWPGKLEIPATVGNTKVVGIATGCFSDARLNEAVESLVIADNSISTIEAGVFQASENPDDLQWKKLEKVYIGNSVTSIGNNAFKNCSSLVDVTFNSPSGGHEAFTIGTDAFKTESGELTFHGDIVEGYAPFDWAMDPGNIIQAQDRIRVCYKSLSPSYLTVMYNPVTDMVTLLDYPKYSQLSQILNENHGYDPNSGDYEKNMVANWYNMYQVSNYDSYRTNFAVAWSEAQAETDADTRNEMCEALYASDSYGPWINEAFCREWNKWVSGAPGGDTNSGSSGTQNPDGGEGDSAKNSLTDWLFEPIIVQAAEDTPASRDPLPYYTRNEYDIVSNVDSGDPYRFSEEERQLVNATKNIVVPEGVESIDVYGYINNLTVDGERAQGENSGANTGNYNTYFNLNWPSTTRNMYNSKASGDADDPTDVVPGLFSGYYKDFKNTSGNELFARGNDLIESVTLNSVKYLPDYAFDSCESLQWVIIGSDLTDIGKAPFRGCYKMTAVSNNDYYTTENGIIYSNNSDGSLTIEECLSARGNGVGEGIVSITSDSNLANVSAIKPGAFEDCDNITSISFGMEDTAGLTVIPDDCFKNCDRLASVILPRTVNDVGKGAFVGSNALNTLTFYGKEVKISGSAFDNSDNQKGNTLVRTYDDSAVVRYVNEYGKEYNLTLDNNRLGELWAVTFLDADHMMMSDLKDKEGNEIENPQYVEDGAYATVPQDPVHEDWTFEKWVGMNGADISDKITEDTIFYAQGYSNSGMVNGKYMVEFYDGIDGAKIGPTQYISPGGEAIAPAPPTHSGYTFDKWSDSYTDIQANKSIVALYTGGNTTNTSGNTTNTSGNTTNTSGNTTSSSSNTTSNTSSSSSSSTSTSSTTSGSDSASAMHRVTVVNGSGSGTYATGATVVIAANEPAAGMRFTEWTTESSGVTLNQITATSTMFTMPENDVLVLANFEGAVAAAADTTGDTANNTGTATNNSGSTDSGNTRVDITKPGISNKDLATANVNGSTDNFVVKIAETDEATKAVADALANKYDSLENILYYAMDITLWDATGTYRITEDQLAGITVDITIPIPDALVAYGGNNMAGAVVNGNQLEELNESFTTINGVPCIKFTASHFSPYTIYVDTGNLTEGMLDTTPKTGDPIHPKWFLSIGLACLSVILFMKRDKRTKGKTA